MKKHIKHIVQGLITNLSGQLIILGLILFMPLTSVAQDFPGFDSQQMQGMMQKAQEMQSCMKNIDQAEMKALEQKGKQMQAEVKKLCAAGKRDQALDKAIAYGKEMAKSSAIQEMKKCGEKMQGMMPELSKFSKDYSNDGSEDEGHICDNWE